VKPTIVVTFDRLKRLRARSVGGGIVYREVEDLILNAFANYAQSQKVLSLREGDDVTLGLPPVELDARGLEELVLIASIEQSSSSPKDSAFTVATKAQGWAPGTHVLQVPKWYSRPPDQFNPKPTWMKVAGYELTYTVRFVNVGGAVLDQPLTEGGGSTTTAPPKKQLEQRAPVIGR
jgi:hypothetical protein